MKSSAQKPKFGSLKLTLLLVFAVLLLFILNITLLNKHVDFWQHHGLDKAQSANLIIESTPVGDGIAEYDGIKYISLTALKKHIDPNIYYNSEEGRVIITTDKDVLRINTGESEYLLNDDRLELNFPVYDDNGKIYMPVEITESIYGIQASELNGGAFFSLDRNFSRGTVLKKTKLYAYPEDPEYFSKVKKDTEVLVYGSQNGRSLVKIMTEGKNAGFVGYIKDELLNIEPNTAKSSEKTAELWQPDQKINLIFDQISNASGAAVTIAGGRPKGTNVICPTWFSFEGTNGEIVNKANKDYVNWAKTNGLKVWGLLTDNFDGTVSHAVLTDDETRAYVIEQIIAYALMYDLDGINIDFESVPSDDGKYWIQFLRELVPICHQNGLIVSADLFVPKRWTAHYNRREVGETVDYVIVMGYDEHYSGSDKAGSVASLDWSKQAIEATLSAGVPKEKLILGIPFYTRLWLEAADGSLETAAYSMDAALEKLNENNANITFDEETGQNYGEYTDDLGRHRCWLEDADSVKARIGLVNENDIAGVAEWKLRMQSDGIFELIDETLAQKEN